jgi:endonuclease/exonuclease/phosphatase family metal-dependent hydrolase
MERRLYLVAAAATTAAMTACAPDEAPLEAHLGSAAIALEGDRVLDVVSWNIEWFGAQERGPWDDELQLDTAAEVITRTDGDVWGVQEIVSGRQFSRLADAMGYESVLADDDLVEEGGDYYSPDEQKVGLLYDARRVRLRSAAVVLGAYNRDFAGRPPLEVRLAFRRDDGSDWRFTVLVVHMKADAAVASYDRRARAARVLKGYLDDRADTEPVLVIGDWNDDLDTSQTRGWISPYAPFVDDAERYLFPTEVFSPRDLRTHVAVRVPLDHHLATRAAARRYLRGSAEILRPDRYIPDFAETTSDHYPVRTRYEP